MMKDLIKTNENHVRRYEKLKQSITNTASGDTRGIAAPKPKLMVNLQREVSQPLQKANQDHDHETKLENLDHFVALFDRLQQEVTTLSHKIGSRSRSRIEKHILDARTSEATYLDFIHGEAVMRDAWNSVNRQSSLVTPSIDDHGTQQIDPSESTNFKSLADSPHDDMSTSQVPDLSHSQHESKISSCVSAQRSEPPAHPSAGLRINTEEYPASLNRRRRRFPRWLRRKLLLQLPWLQNPLHKRDRRRAIRAAEEAGSDFSFQPLDPSFAVVNGSSPTDKKLDELLRLWTPVAIPLKRYC